MSLLGLPADLFRYIAGLGVLSYSDIFVFSQTCRMTYTLFGSQFWAAIVRQRLTETPLKRSRKELARDLDYPYTSSDRGLRYASRQGYDKLLPSLLRRAKPDPDVVGFLQNAIKGNHMKCFEILYKYLRSDENALWSILITAIKHRRFFFIRHVLSLMNVNAYSMRQYYWIACETGDRKIIAYLEQRTDAAGRDSALSRLTDHPKLFWPRWETASKHARKDALIRAAWGDNVEIIRMTRSYRNPSLVKELLQATLSNSCEKVLQYLVDNIPPYLVREVFVPSHQLYCASREYREIIDTALTYADEEECFDDRYSEYDIVMY